jgi:hypothetical protein
MRTIGSLVLLGVALALLHRFTAAAPLAARAALALGVVVVLAELAGRLAARWRLPRVSGFVSAGIVFGPAWVGLVRAEEAEALRFVGDAAIVSAFRAGSAADRGLTGRCVTHTTSRRRSCSAAVAFGAPVVSAHRASTVPTTRWRWRLPARSPLPRRPPWHGDRDALRAAGRHAGPMLRDIIAVAFSARPLFGCSRVRGGVPLAFGHRRRRWRVGSERCWRS